MKILINNQTIFLDKANNPFKRFFGLMGKKNIKNGIYFPKCNSIHTFFMKEEIDVIMIDNDKKIVLIKENVKRNKVIYKKEAYHTIELPKNTINNKLTLGETLTIID